MTSPTRRIRKAAPPALPLLAPPPADESVEVSPSPDVAVPLVSPANPAAIEGYSIGQRFADRAVGSVESPNSEPSENDGDEFGYSGPEQTEDDDETIELTPGETYILARVEQLAAAISVIGQQQQWMTDNIAAFFNQFEAMGPAGMLKMLSGALIGGGKTKRGNNG